MNCEHFIFKCDYFQWRQYINVVIFNHASIFGMISNRVTQNLEHTSHFHVNIDCHVNSIGPTSDIQNKSRHFD
jgi:hypothetical protein